MPRKKPEPPPALNAPHPRPYLRDGVPGLPMAEQEAMLTEAGIDLTDAYRDTLSRAKIKSRDPAHLVQRGFLLRPTARRTPETIYVASLRVLGWNPDDLAQAVVLAGQRNASICAVDTGTVHHATTIRGAEDLVRDLGDAWTAHKRGATLAGRTASAEARSQKAEARRSGKLAKARTLWALPPADITNAEIAAQVGMSVRSLQQHLGSRADALAKATGRKPHA